MADDFKPFVPRQSVVAGDALAQLLHHTCKQLEVDFKCTGNGQNDLKALLIDYRSKAKRNEGYLKAWNHLIDIMAKHPDISADGLKAEIAGAILTARTNADLWNAR